MEDVFRRGTGGRIGEVGRRVRRHASRSSTKAASRSAALSVGLGTGRAGGERRLFEGGGRAFGKPIADFQALRWMMADMAHGAGGPGAAAGVPGRAAARRTRESPTRREAAMAKLFASEGRLPGRPAHGRAESTGGYGFTKEFLVGAHLPGRQALHHRRWGTSEVQPHGDSRASCLKGVSGPGRPRTLGVDRPRPRPG